MGYIHLDDSQTVVVRQVSEVNVKGQNTKLLDDLRGDFWSNNSLACTLGPISWRRISYALTLAFGRLSFGLWGASVANKLTQELELRQEELPDYIPTKQHEEERTSKCGQNDQQCESDTLPHLSWTLESNNSIRRKEAALFLLHTTRNVARLADGS